MVDDGYERGPKRWHDAVDDPSSCGFILLLLLLLLLLQENVLSCAGPSVGRLSLLRIIMCGCCLAAAEWMNEWTCVHDEKEGRKTETKHSLVYNLTVGLALYLSLICCWGRLLTGKERGI